MQTSTKLTNERTVKKNDYRVRTIVLERTVVAVLVVEEVTTLNDTLSDTIRMSCECVMLIEMNR